MSGQVFVRVAYGVLQTLTLIAAIPHMRRYFFSERWGGYTQSNRWTDAVQNPAVCPALIAVWLGASLSLVAGWMAVAAAAVNLALCYYFFIGLRWRGALRGMGAPGFLSFWLGAAVFVLEFTSRVAPAVRPLGLLTLQVDFALMMMSAGLYKAVAGYRQGSGMELGMVNPEWGYWTAFWRRWSPRHRLFRVLNEMAWLTELAAGCLMLIPATRSAGAIVILVSFVFIATQIRLGFLPEMVVVCCVLFLPVMNTGDSVSLAASNGLEGALTAVCLAYLILLPVVRVGMFYNQIAHKSLPQVLQRALDGYANAVGLILWRVFTADIVGFFVRVWEPAADGARTLVSDYEGLPLARRFRQVAECIAITSVFTTLRYYPSDRRRFVDRLLRYARTLVPAPVLVFEWVGIVKLEDRFEFVPAVEYTVDLAANTVDEKTLRTDLSPMAPAGASPLHEGALPGSYAPLGR